MCFSSRRGNLLRVQQVQLHLCPEGFQHRERKKVQPAFATPWEAWVLRGAAEWVFVPVPHAMQGFRQK